MNKQIYSLNTKKEYSKSHGVQRYVGFVEKDVIENVKVVNY